MRRFRVDGVDEPAIENFRFRQRPRHVAKLVEHRDEAHGRRDVLRRQRRAISRRYPVTVQHVLLVHDAGDTAPRSSQRPADSSRMSLLARSCARRNDRTTFSLFMASSRRHDAVARVIRPKPVRRDDDLPAGEPPGAYGQGRGADGRLDLAVSQRSQSEVGPGIVAYFDVQVRIVLQQVADDDIMDRAFRRTADDRKLRPARPSRRRARRFPGNGPGRRAPCLRRGRRRYT